MDTTPARWKRVKELFQTALDLEPSQRLTFLADNCPDEEVRKEVEALLSSYEDAGSFLNNPVVNRLWEDRATEASPDSQATCAPFTTVPDKEVIERMTGRRLGAYKVVRRIGQGGMAAVFLATRADDEYQKQVAIKLVQPGLDSRELLSRFRKERQTLADLDHPNIVKLLDGGSTPEGSPFLVMDYVEGTPIDDYCDKHKLSIDERLRLFSKVCEAVQYAHQKSIVHRDLKPSNILVTDDGTPKVLDFGIAKVLSPPSSAQTLLLTQTGTRCMTPAYASPEQMRGNSITIATDVYSLGVVLYELLSGHRPYRFKENTPVEIERAICEQEPEPPSAAISRVESEITSNGVPVTKTPELVSGTREGGPEKLRRHLRGDLDNIVLKALQKEPDRRYASVEEFSQDIACHLAHLPVKARPATAIYRASKFIRRHKTEVGAAVVVIFVLCIATIAAFAYWWAAFAQPPRVLGYTQITHDGHRKIATGSEQAASVTDGPRVFFNEGTGDNGLIPMPVQVSSEGGETVPLPVPFEASGILDISPSTSELLAISYSKNADTDHALWAVPVLGGSPRRLGNVKSVFAAWSPDAKKLLFAQGSDLYLANYDGMSPQKLVTVPGVPGWVVSYIPGWPRWSPDSKRIRFSLQDPQTLSFALWEVSADGSNLHPLLPGWNTPPAECCGVWTPDGRYFIFQSTREGRTDLWAMREKTNLFQRSKRDPIQLTSGPISFLGPTVSRDGKLFALGIQSKNELVRYDVRSKQLQLYLSGMSAEGLDFSRDGQWVTYVAIPEGTLWRSKLDGRQRVQLTFPPLQVALPQWSPGEKQIAFMGRLPGQLWQIYVLPAEGGSPLQVVSDRENEGEPDWSPDGRLLLYSQLPLMKVNAAEEMVIHALDLTTHQVSILPGSEGLHSARWSPDGSYVVASTTDDSSLMGFELATQRWKMLSQPGGRILGWSRQDGQVYLENFGDIYTLRFSNGHRRQLASVKGIQRGTGILGFMSWAGLAPDDSILLVRETSSEEWYAIKWDAP